jgi:putative phage-type endonuclease
MQGIGASDAPIIMGDSPWMTAKELLELKVGKRQDAAPNWAMRRGSTLEEPARELYMQKTGKRVSPQCFEHSRYAWKRASLDGLSDDGRFVLEIKCPGLADHASALHGRVPPKYLAQIQHLLAVSEADTCHYWSYRDGRGVLLEVPADSRYMDRLHREEAAFWDRVQTYRQ